VNEVLQIDKIYNNAIKGDMAKKEDLESVFPNMSYEEIVKLILDKGEIQISEKERNLNFQNTKNNIASIVVEKTYNKDNGMPFPQNVILEVLDNINFQIKDNEDAKKQALKAIKLISDKNILPIERKLMQIFISFKNSKNISEKEFEEFKNKFQEFLKNSNSQILEINLDSPKQFRVKCNISPNHYREFLTNYEEGKN
jgi:ribosome maturation protein SDO1